MHSTEILRQLEPLEKRRAELQPRESQLAAERATLADRRARLIADAAPWPDVEKTAKQLRAIDDEIAGITGALEHLKREADRLTPEYHRLRAAEELAAAEAAYDQAAGAAVEAREARAAEIRRFALETLATHNAACARTMEAGRQAADRVARARAAAGYSASESQRAFHVEAVGDVSVANVLHLLSFFAQTERARGVGRVA